MTYLSLARKYRPQEFDEIVGQEHIAITLKNAIAMNRVAHAYLFAGPRGVGKTSTARILAKSLNCEKGPTDKPCQKCPSCLEISQGVGFDVIEIDGASNRGIDEIRNLKENIKFASVRGKFRIYIIDEVHMLTQEAFNALLKTLEEPPQHVKFIFATTRPYKVLPTIMSRCQRFDFRKISTQDLAKKLEEIKKKESLKIKSDAIFLIARTSDGSMRDAEMILDQLLSFTKSEIRSEDVSKILGLLQEDALFSIADCMINNEKGKMLDTVNELTSSGKDPIFIASGIINHFRNLMVAKLAKDKKGASASLSEEDYRRLQEQSRGFSLDEILYITYTLSAAIDLMKKTSLSQIPLEIALVKLCEKGRLISIKEILGKLSNIESGASSPAPQILPEPVEAEKPVEKPPVVAEEEVAAEKDILTLQKMKTSWHKILNLIKNKKMSLATFFSEGAFLHVKDNILTVGFNKNNILHKEAVESDPNKKFIEDIIKNVTGENILLNIISVEGELAGKAETTSREEEPSQEPPAERSNRIEPIVESAIDIFDGRIIDIREKRKP